MANHKSAEKRARVSERRRTQNREYLSSVRTAIKKFRLSAAAPKLEKGVKEKLFLEAQSIIQKAAQKGLIHKNNAARKVSRLAKLLSPKKDK